MPFDPGPETETDLGMTLETMERIGERAKAIKSATRGLREAEKELETLLKYRGEKDSWKVTLTVEKADRYSGRRDTTVEFHVPFAMVQQRLLDNVKRAKRKVIQLGGRP